MARKGEEKTTVLVLHSFVSYFLFPFFKRVFFSSLLVGKINKFLVIMWHHPVALLAEFSHVVGPRLHFASELVSINACTSCMPKEGTVVDGSTGPTTATTTTGDRDGGAPHSRALQAVECCDIKRCFPRDRERFVWWNVVSLFSRSFLYECLAPCQQTSPSHTQSRFRLGAASPRQRNGGELIFAHESVGVTAHIFNVDDVQARGERRRFAIIVTHGSLETLMARWSYLRGFMLHLSDRISQQAESSSSRPTWRERRR